MNEKENTKQQSLNKEQWFQNNTLFPTQKMT